MNSRRNRSTVCPSEVERLLHHMPTVAERAESDWVKGFAHSVLRQSRRRGWFPSQRQVSMMSGLVTDLFINGDDGGELNVIE